MRNYSPHPVGVVLPPENAGTISKPMIKAVTAKAAAQIMVDDIVNEVNEVAVPSAALPCPGPSPSILPFIYTKKTLKDRLAELTAKRKGSVYESHIEILNAALQTELAKYKDSCLDGWDIQLVAVEVNEKINKIIENGELDDEEDGRAWPNQAETLADAIVKILRNPHKSLVIIGSTQLGKTMTVILMAVFELLLWIKTGEMYKAIYLSPPHVAITEQTKRDFAGFYGLYDFRVACDEEGSILYSQYRKTLRSMSIKIDDEDNPEVGDCPVRSRQISNVKQLEAILQRVHKAGCRVIFVIDECHWGSEQEIVDHKGNTKGRNGIMSQILKFARNLTDADAGDLVVAISATPFNMNTKNLSVVYCKTYLGYVGYAFWLGQLLDERYPLRLPDVYGFGQIGKMYGINDFWCVNRNYYRNLKGSYDDANCEKYKRGSKKDSYTPFASRWHNTPHEKYRMFCEDKLIELAKKCLVYENPKNAKGFFIRFFLRNDEIRDFIKRRQKDLGNIKLVQWTDTGAKERLDKYLEQEGIPHDALKVILVSGGGRMGVRIHDKLRIYYGADFSESSNLTSLLQGLLGRMTGHKSEVPTMFINDDINDILQKYVITRGKNVEMKQHTRTIQVNNIIRGDGLLIWCCTPVANKKGVRWADLGLPEAEAYIESFTKKWLHGCDDLRSGQHKRMAYADKLEFWLKFNEFLRQAEKRLGLPVGSLVLYNPCPDNLAFPYVDEGGHSYDGNIGFRNAENAAFDGNLRSDRITSNNKKDKLRNLQPQIHAEGPTWTGRNYSWKAVAVKVRFHSHTVIGETLHLPMFNDVGSSFLNDEEKELVSFATIAKKRSRK